MLQRLYDRVTKKLPAPLAGRLDYSLKPSYRTPLGGPLNGQQQRQRIVRELAARIPFDEVVETGTFRATTTSYFSYLFGVPVTTVEAHPRYYAYSRRILQMHPDVTPRFGDSRAALRALAARPSTNNRTVFFYLDAHWNEDLPLHEEVEIIRGTWSRAVVLIDDFKVEGDEGYGFDDYGPHKRLALEILPELPGWGTFFPQAPSLQETGARRGSVLLASPDLVNEVSTVRSLRRYTA